MRETSINLIRHNIARLLENSSCGSMRSLSTKIHASDSYIEKILSGKSSISLEKLDVISHYFDTESWVLLFDDSDALLPVIQKLNHLSPEYLPVFEDFTEHLVNLHEQLQSNTPRE